MLNHLCLVIHFSLRMPFYVLVCTGSCGHGGVVNISKPAVVQLNWRGFAYKYGAWGRDYSPQHPEGGLYWVAPLNTDGRTLEYYRLHNTLDDLLLYINARDYRITYGQGGGTAVYNSFMYVNWYNTGSIAKINLSNNRAEVTQISPTLPIITAFHMLMLVGKILTWLWMRMDCG